MIKETVVAVSIITMAAGAALAPSAVSAGDQPIVVADSHDDPCNPCALVILRGLQPLCRVQPVLRRSLQPVCLLTRRVRLTLSEGAASREAAFLFRGRCGTSRLGTGGRPHFSRRSGSWRPKRP